MLIHARKLRINLDVAPHFDDHLLAKDFVNLWVINEELVVAWTEERGKYVVSITWLLRGTMLILDAIGLVYILDWQNVILVAFVVKKSIPANELRKDVHFLYAMVHFAFKKLVQRLLDRDRVHRAVYECRIRRAT